MFVVLKTVYHSVIVLFLRENNKLKSLQTDLNELED